ncbi:MAG: hypothetical protein QM648_07050 [Solirubrobacterales bacterium]
MSERLVILAIIVASAALVGALANVAIRRRHHIDRIDAGDFAPGSGVVVFTSPYCHGCRQWLEALAEDGQTTATIDIAERPEAAARYRITSTPRVVVVDGSGTVLREFHHYAPRRSDLDQIAKLASA